MRLLILAFILAVFSVGGFAQKTSLPAYTGYAVPAETDEADLFNAPSGVSNWSDTHQKLTYYFYVSKPGMLHLDINMKNAVAGSVIKATLYGKSFTLNVPAAKKMKPVNVGSVIIKDSGFYTITLTALKKAGKQIAAIQSLELSGSAVVGLHANKLARRNAASVHLKYPLADSIKAIAFYNEITIPKEADMVHSYYMACGFARGYFGIQVNSPTERRVIFSVWDSGNEAVDRNKVADSNKVELVAKGDAVIAGGFGDEGTGGHSHWVYPWKAGETYKMMVTALTDSTTTFYTGYFFVPELQKWKLIASFKAPHDGQPLRNLYSFNENFVGLNGQLKRKAFFGNQWVQDQRGRWIELTQSSFSYDATGKAGDRIDYGGGTEAGQFYLWNGGFEKSTAVYGQLFNRAATNLKPVIDWTRNADSAAQAKKDKALIDESVRTKKIDTTGSIDGVFYQILKEGTGQQVAVTDTVTVFYKGILLSDGSVFDQTKDKPATFPLNRLIKGWQIAVPKCRVGGTIRIVIPSGLAYTIRSRSKAIPPNSVLVFDIEVLAAKPG